MQKNSIYLDLKERLEIMKKKVISAVLFGALALASTGTFVSCNDYDDEVNNLQEQINEDRAKSAALQNQLESYKAALENELKELKASYETQIAEAKAALESELQKKADATVVEALVERIVSLETGLSASVATLQSQIDVCNSAIEKLNAAISHFAEREDKEKNESVKYFKFRRPTFFRIVKK